MRLFQKESKTEEQVRNAVNNAVKSADAEMARNSIKNMNDKTLDTIEKIPTLAAGVAAVETVMDAGKAIADTTKTAAVDFVKDDNTKDQANNYDFDM